VVGNKAIMRLNLRQRKKILAYSHNLGAHRRYLLEIMQKKTTPRYNPEKTLLAVTRGESVREMLGRGADLLGCAFLSVVDYQTVKI